MSHVLDVELLALTPQIIFLSSMLRVRELGAPGVEFRETLLPFIN
jgi:hypothetical protein